KAALDILRHMPPAEKIANPEDWWKERHIMARRLMERRQFRDAYALVRQHGQTDGASYAEAEWLAGWLALEFLNNPARAYQHFEAMFERVNTPVSRARGAYWAAQAALQMKADALAETWLRNAAPYQTVYYGQLAGARLGLEQALSHAAPPKLNDADKQSYKSDELIRAARIFSDAGQSGRSGRFVHAFIARNTDPKAYRFAAEFAAEMGQYKQTIQIAKKATQEGLFLTLQSYPVIADHLRQVRVEWALVHALIRQESQFDPQARSPAGALGLMQLMPATAREVGRKIGYNISTAALTANPQANIRLGTAYLQRLLDKYDNAYPLAIAAYNAGPSRVDEWLETFGDPRQGRIDWINWIETIPIYETRNYVQRVMEGVYVYRLRLKNIQKIPQEPLHVAYAEQALRESEN
ncbi:MAG: lytic transglycosylase domain-containing protein, partial [Alphaproteobacteria bacterium]|nr:lytic transglycosylase domain-containing protein [Alphaproteobacteria bacterium]